MADDKPAEPPVYTGTLMEVTNNSEGPRVFHTPPLIAGSPPDRVTLNPGESRTFSVITPEHLVYKSWIAEGKVKFGEPSDIPAPPPPGRTPLIEPQSAKPTKS